MRPRSAWIVFAVAFAVVLAVMARGTTALLDLERERMQTEQRALLEEQVRLALWRMDTAMTPILAIEMAGSELGAPLPRAVMARFSIDTLGEVAVHGPLDERLRRELQQRLSAEMGASPSITLGLRAEDDDDLLQQALSLPVAQQSQSVRNVNEYSKRAGKVADNFEAYQSSIDQRHSLGNDLAIGDESPEALETEPMRVQWIADHLVVVRSSRSDAAPRHAGSVLDWHVVQTLLLDEVRDLLPGATLEPASDGEDLDGRRLATLPVALVPGELHGAPAPVWSPLRATVATGWGFLLLAGIAVGLLLRGSLALSERRAAFVSAVTHELRTPLTTFRMYTEMLEQGMVEAKRARYLATLRREAERLGNLVENVLTYARIESDRIPRALETISVIALVERMRERLEQRCATATLELEVEVPADLEQASVRVDPAAIEQIVFNLVDNAAKYAPSVQHPIVHFEVRPSKGSVELHVRDHGPGIPLHERRRIFEPFAKATEHAAGTQPGVGLGLALSRRLARDLGGDLELRDTANGGAGANFVLTLRLQT